MTYIINKYRKLKMEILNKNISLRKILDFLFRRKISFSIIETGDYTKLYFLGNSYLFYKN